jgi:hypothetical protein
VPVDLHYGFTSINFIMAQSHASHPHSLPGAACHIIIMYLRILISSLHMTGIITHPPPLALLQHAHQINPKPASLEPVLYPQLCY